MTSRIIPAIKAFATTALMATLLSACGSRVTSENYDRIETGMTRAEVVAVLGEPDETASAGIGNLTGEAATWVEGEDFITIQFVNDKVMAKQASIRSRKPREAS